MVVVVFVLEDGGFLVPPVLFDGGGRVAVAQGRCEPVTSGLAVVLTQVADEADGFAVRWNFYGKHGQGKEGKCESGDQDLKSLHVDVGQ